MTTREGQMNSRKFELGETRRKLRDLSELKRHIESSLDRLGGSAPAVGAAVDKGDALDANGADRRATLMRSLDEINRSLAETEKAFTSGQDELEHQEMVENGYDRIPVAVGNRRGRNQVEHIRIVRSQRGNES